MLYHEVAVDPEALASDELQIYLKSVFGLGKGRFISAFPKDWANQVRRHANNSTDPYKKKRISSLLATPEFSQSIVDVGRGKVIGPWKEHVLAEHKINPFNAIFSTEKTTVPYYSVEEIDAYIAESDNQIGHLDVSRNLSTDDVVDALAPFLIQNRRLTLVNAYQLLLTETKTEHLFKKLFKFWAIRGGCDFTVIRSTRSLTPGQFDKEAGLLEKFLWAQRFTGTFKYIAVDDSLNGRLHERYLIGPFSGIEMGYGLELNSKPQRWKILLKAPYIEVRRNYMDLDIRDNYAMGGWQEYLYRPKTTRR